MKNKHTAMQDAFLVWARLNETQARLDALLAAVEDFHRAAQPDAASMNAAIQAAKRVQA